MIYVFLVFRISKKVLINILHFSIPSITQVQNAPDAGVLFWSRDILGQESQVSDESRNVTNHLRMFCGGGGGLSLTRDGVAVGDLLSKESQLIDEADDVVWNLFIIACSSSSERLSTAGGGGGGDIRRHK